MLRDGEGVAIGVFEPRDGSTARSLPDALLVLRHGIETKELDALRGELGDDGVDMGDSQPKMVYLAGVKGGHFAMRSMILLGPTRKTRAKSSSLSKVQPRVFS